MGLYDNIIIDRESLANIDERVDKYLSLVEGSEIDFQTKDFECLLSTYYVKDNQLFIKESETEWVESDDKIFGGYLNEISHSLMKSNETATIYFYDSINGDSVDIWIEFKAVFIHGALSKIELFKFEETSSKERIERHEKWLRELKEYNDYKKTLRGKIVIWCKNKIRFVLKKISLVFKKLTSALDKLIINL